MGRSRSSQSKESIAGFDLISKTDEEAAVGSLLLGADCTNVRPETFGISGLRQVVEAILSLKEKGQPADAVLVKGEMLERGTLGALGHEPDWTLTKLFED